jgi:hypothetical protein
LIRVRIQSAKRLYGRRLLCAYLSHGDLGHVEILSAGGTAGEAPEHGKLANVREGVCDGSLEEAINRGMERLWRGKIIVECLESSEEPLRFSDPGKRPGSMPAFTSLHRTQSPVEEISHVSKDLGGLTPGGIEFREGVGGTVDGAGGPVSKTGYGVAQEFAFRVHAPVLYRSPATSEKIFTFIESGSVGAVTLDLSPRFAEDF